MSHALGALCVQGDMRLDVRLQRQKTRLCGALNTRPGNSGFQREDGPGAQAGDGMDAGISSLRGLAVQTLRGHEETVWKFAHVCNMCGSHSRLRLSGDWPSGTNKPGHRGARGNCIDGESGDLRSGPDRGA